MNARNVAYIHITHSIQHKQYVIAFALKCIQTGNSHINFITDYTASDYFSHLWGMLCMDYTSFWLSVQKRNKWAPTLWNRYPNACGMCVYVCLRTTVYVHEPNSPWVLCVSAIITYMHIMPPYHDAHGKICKTIFIRLLITAPLNAPFKLKLFMRFHYILCLF